MKLNKVICYEMYGTTVNCHGGFMSQEIHFKQYTPNANYYTPIPMFTPYLRVCGQGVVRQNDLTNINMWPATFEPGNYTAIEFDSGITGAKAGFLESFYHLEKLILSESVQSIDDTKELSEMLTNNQVIVRGTFDTFAEEFAHLHHLRFVHANIDIANSSNQYETDVWTLRFEDNGTPYLHCNAFGQGGFMGGEQRSELPDGIFDNCTIEKFAELFGKGLTEQILQNKPLQRFLQRMNLGKH